MKSKKKNLNQLSFGDTGSNKAELCVFGSGRPMRQFIYAGDLGRLLLWTLRSYEETEPIILSVDASDEISIGQAAEAIAKALERRLGVQFELRFDQTQPDGQHRKTASNLKLRRYLPQFEFTRFEAGVERTVDWFCEHYDRARK